MAKTMRLSVGPEDARSPEDSAEHIPYSDLSELLKEAIEDAIREAWSRLPDEAAKQGISLVDAAETTITRMLEDELEKIRRNSNRTENGFNDAVFCCVSEGGSAPDQTGRPFDDNTGHPDLIIRPRNIPAGVIRVKTYGLFIECKIIENSKDDHGVSHYCKLGLRRFVDGSYACVMPSGMMIAYVRRRLTINRHLTGYLRTRQGDFEVLSLPTPHPRRGVGANPNVFVSRHGRASVRVGGRGRCPGPIEIAHLWLGVDMPGVSQSVQLELDGVMPVRKQDGAAG